MYDAPHQRVKEVSITLECTPGSHQTQCEALEGAGQKARACWTNRGPPVHSRVIETFFRRWWGASYIDRGS